MSTESPDQTPAPDPPQSLEHVVEWTRAGTLERVVCRGASAEDRAREWVVAMRDTDIDTGAKDVKTFARPEDTGSQFPAAVHVGGPTVTLRLGNRYQDLGKQEEFASTFFDGANATERATEFAARAKERAY